MEENQTNSNPFYKTVNNGYGKTWMASHGKNPH